MRLLVFWFLCLFAIPLCSWGYNFEHHQWKTGQVVAISELKFDPSTLLFELTTSTRFGHVGIVAVEAEGIFVYESTPPRTRKTPINEYLQKSFNSTLNQYEASVLETVVPITKQQETELINVMKSMEGTPYHFLMNPKADGTLTSNCSGFVLDAFHKAKLQFRTRQTHITSQLNDDALGGLINEFFINRKLNRNSSEYIVTPADIVHSKSLRVVGSNLPVDKLLSEKEILAQWESAGAFDDFIKRNIDYGPTALRKKLKEIGASSQEIKDYFLRHASERPKYPYPSLWRSPNCNYLFM